jgi:hypothetical protein
MEASSRAQTFRMETPRGEEKAPTFHEAIFGKGAGAARSPAEMFNELLTFYEARPVPGGIRSISMEAMMDFFKMMNPKKIPFVADVMVNFGNGMVGLGLYAIPAMGGAPGRAAKYTYMSDVLIMPGMGGAPAINLRGNLQQEGTWSGLISKREHFQVSVSPTSYIPAGKTPKGLVPLELSGEGAVVGAPVATFTTTKGPKACGAIMAPILLLLQKITVGGLAPFGWTTTSKAGATYAILVDPILFYNTTSGELVAIVTPFTTDRVHRDPRLHQFFIQDGEDQSPSINEGIQAMCRKGG